MTAADVISGQARWAVECADALEFLRALPDDSIDLLFTSPPYLEARTYGIGAGRKLDDWVTWMTEVVTAAAPKVKGLIAVNCEGQTREYRYLPAPFLLMARLHDAGFNLRKPPVFHRVGIPGSGGPDWLRNDYEPIVCVTRPGKLPWSDNIACGEPCKYGPGGAPSYRRVDGARVTAQTTTRKNRDRIEPQVAAAVAGEIDMPPGSRLHRLPQQDGTMRTKLYRPPGKANPGNVLEFNAGGGHMGHPIAHENEAPFPLDLPAFFVKSFCPPDGIACDPFSGSGTTLHAAFENGRKFVGCDIRQSQVSLATRRVKTVTAGMFAV